MSDAAAIDATIPAESGFDQKPPAAGERQTIVTCPVCEIRYRVDAAALGGPAGREVRCASCGNSWHYSPEGAAIQAAVAEAAAATLKPDPAAFPVMPTLEPERLAATAQEMPPPAAPAILPRPSVEVEAPARRSRPLRFLGIGLLALAVAAVVLALFGRQAIVARWPATAPLYARLHLAPAPGEGLKVSVTPTRTADALIIKGLIINGAGAVRPIPRLRVSLRDGRKALLVSKVIAPPVAQLPAGGSAHFDAKFEHPSAAAKDVEVIFVGS